MALEKRKCSGLQVWKAAGGLGIEQNGGFPAKKVNPAEARVKPFRFLLFSKAEIQVKRIDKKIKIFI
jgi:hypothetical protein